MKYISFFILLLFAAGLNAQCLYTTDCNVTINVCDLTPNNGQLWSEIYWWDPVNQSIDLSEMASAVSAQVTDTCPNAVVTVDFLLHLDLDNNGSQETVLKSWDLPAAGTVRYNNSNNPDFSGGDTRVFDERPVATGDKYRFALETVTSGNTLTARLRWNTSNHPAIFQDAELPLGHHRIQWSFQDNVGNVVFCESNIHVTDCKNPTVVCHNGLSINVLPDEHVTVWATDLLYYGEDNSTPSNLLEYSVRRSGAGAGFPLDGQGNPVPSLTYDCSELGTQAIDLWARDASGNADYCSTYVIIQDNAGNCGGGGGGEAPAVVCLNGVTVTLQQNGTAPLPAMVLLQNAYDNNTPFNELDFAIRRSGTGTGFPVDGQGNPIQNILLETADLGVVVVEIWARDTDGNADYCETYALVQAYNGNSGAAPTLVCHNGISLSMPPSGLLQLWTTDFLSYVEDDNTPANQIVLGIRKKDAGVGFPTDGQGNPIQQVVFDCNELGTQEVELWAKDIDGNTTYCNTYALIQDPMGVCPNAVDVNQIACIHRWCDNAAVTGVQFTLTGNETLTDDPNSDGCYFIVEHLPNLPPMASYHLTPQKNDHPMNGVTAFDLYKMSRHILGIEPLGTYSMIAADINKSGTVTSFDLVEGRKLIQGIYQTFPSNHSWRFIDAAFAFPNPNNPFMTVFPEYSNIPNTSLNSGGQSNFIAIKVGDVDCDGFPGAAPTADDRQVRLLSLPDRMLQAGETADIPVAFAADGNWTALQAGFRFDPAMVSVEAGDVALPGLDQASFASPRPGALNLVWYGMQPTVLKAGQPLFSLRVRAQAPLRLSEALQLAAAPGDISAQAFDVQQTPQRLELAFRNGLDDSAGGRVFAAQPNPTAQSAEIPLVLAVAAPVRLQLSDVSGKIIWEQTVSLPAGEYRMEIPAEAMPDAGLYFWQLTAGELQGTGKVVKK